MFTNSPYPMKVDPVLTECVYLIGDFPPLPPVLFDTREELALLQEERESWQAISLWLRHLMLGEALSEEAYTGKALYRMHSAEWLVALANLITSVHPRTDNPQLRSFSSPALLWYHCVWTWAQRELDATGVVGSPPVIIPKRENYKAVRKLCSELEKRRWVPDDPYPFDDYPEATIFLEAQHLAITCTTFRNRVFRPFLKNWRHIAQYVKECKHLQDSCLLPDGEIFTTGKHKKLPPSL